MQEHSFGHSNYASTIKAVLYCHVLQATTFNCLECKSPVSLDRGECLCSQDPELRSPLCCEQVTLAALCNQGLYPLLHKLVFSTVRFRGVNSLHLTDKLVLSTCHLHMRIVFSMLSRLRNWSLALRSCLCSAGPIQAPVHFFSHLPIHGPAQ